MADIAGGGENHGRGGRGNGGINFGIGMTIPDSKLEVKDGDIRVTNGSFIDDGTILNAPDYVFEEDYQLMSLDELEEFIRQKKHLPNMPSAEEIKENGLNLSQFQMRLLEKIEELTLYTVAQREEIEKLRTQSKINKAQEEKIKVLENENELLKDEVSEFKKQFQVMEIKMDRLTVQDELKKARCN